ncbi:MAG TPA: cyclodeaminase/cyclohydrolase family protein [Candidatus Limnocylindria bacterium]|nr:cyclodeaminase/cyclohydrolase family protein [Candidatus Limnocylindria bacterium]
MDPTSDSLAGLTLTQFSDSLASAEPVPGGGSASAIAGSFAGSLLAMVARLSADRPKYAAYQKTHGRALATGERGRSELLRLADEDARAYAGFAAARKMPKETETEIAARDEATRVAARASTEVPLSVVDECSRLLEDVVAMAGRSNLNASSDLEVAARLSAAAARGAAANVLINLPMVGDEEYAVRTTASVGGMLDRIERNAAMVSEIVLGGGLRDPEPE